MAIVVMNLDLKNEFEVWYAKQMAGQFQERLERHIKKVRLWSELGIEKVL